MIDPLLDLLQRIRAEDASAREADDRHDFATARHHDSVSALLLERLYHANPMTPAGAAAVLETAETLVAGSGLDADAADRADAAELGAIARRFQAGEIRADDRAFLAYMVADNDGLGARHFGAVRLVRAVARSACRPSFGMAQAAQRVAPSEPPIGQAELRVILKRVARSLRRDAPPAPADVAKLEDAARHIRESGGRATVAVLIETALASAKRLGLVTGGPLH